MGIFQRRNCSSLQKKIRQRRPLLGYGVASDGRYVVFPLEHYAAKLSARLNALDYSVSMLRIRCFDQDDWYVDLKTASGEVRRGCCIVCEQYEVVRLVDDDPVSTERLIGHVEADLKRLSMELMLKLTKECDTIQQQIGA